MGPKTLSFPVFIRWPAELPGQVQKSHANHETYFSAESPEARSHPWVSRPQRDPKRSQGPWRPSGEGPRAPHALNPEATRPRAGERFPTALRLLRSRSFKRVFANPRRFGGTGFQVLACRSESGHARLGLAISKRCAARAVDRNRLKRVIRESFRTVADQLPPLDLVVLCGRDAATLTSPGLRDSLDEAWHQIRNTPWVDF